MKIDLHTPIKRGEQEITEVTLRRPTAGELRGIKLLDIAQMDTMALIELLPRITQPALIKEELSAMELSDFLQLSVEVANFLTPPEKSAQTEYPSE